MWAILFCVLALLGCRSAVATDWKFSGFGTVGYAISDQDFQYLRYIDNGGTFRADSLIGAQAEVQFNSQWGATLQGVISAPRTRDAGLDGQIRWAFVSFRPDNDWLFRVGRLRPPSFIYSQTAEVGVTYDQARLPQEVYALSPVYDFDGGAITKTWALENSEINLDAYWGTADIKFRVFLRELGQPLYISERVEPRGLILSYATSSLLLRGGAHRASVEFTDGPVPGNFVPTTIPFAPPIGGTLYIPSTVSKVNLTVLILGADWRAGDWRFTAEYGQRILNDIDTGPGSKSGSVTVARQFGKWTPYATYARLLSDSKTRRLYQEVSSTPVPVAAQISSPFLPPNYHRLIADPVVVLDQYSTMLGASYSFSATSKLKLEWMRTRVGLASTTLVDGDVSNKSFNVFTLSYSAAF
jgi:hypothetical protein